MTQPRIELTSVPLYLLEGLGVEVVEQWEEHRLVKMKIGIMEIFRKKWMPCCKAWSKT